MRAKTGGTTKPYPRIQKCLTAKWRSLASTMLQSVHDRIKPTALVNRVVTWKCSKLRERRLMVLSYHDSDDTARTILAKCSAIDPFQLFVIHTQTTEIRSEQYSD